VDRVRRAFGEDLCVDLGSTVLVESADESESVLSWARLARLPLDFLVATAPSLLSSCSQSLLSELRSDRVALESPPKRTL
jgi:hypothetical protein